MRKGWLLWLFIASLIAWSNPTLSAQEDDRLDIQGRVELGTPAGTPLPENLPVELQVINVAEVRPVYVVTALTGADGSFVFEGVPAVTGSDVYILYATYDGIRQRSVPFYLEQTGFVTFVLYETTDQPDSLEITSGSIQIDEFTFIQSAGITLEVLMELEVFNRGDRIVTGFSFELPVGAYGVSEVTAENTTDTHLSFESGAIPVVTETVPIIPHWPQPVTIRVTYLLPYPQGAIIDQLFPIAVSGIELRVPDDTVEVTSDYFEPSYEERTSEFTYRVYQQSRELNAGESLIFTLSGKPTQALNDPTQITIANDNDTNWAGALIAAVLGVALLIGGGTWWVWTRRKFENFHD